MPSSRSQAPDRRRPPLLLMVLALMVLALMVLALSIVLAGCGRTASTTSASASRTHREPRTEQALLQIARRFNRDYAANRDGAVYDRWDARSRKIISRSEYIRRHRECPTAPGPATIQDAVRAGSWWLVHYSISGITMTDYWRYEHGRWMFDLIRSNPQAVRLYRLPAGKYFRAVGCAGHA